MLLLEKRPLCYPEFVPITGTIMDVQTALIRFLRHHKSQGHSTHTVDAYGRWVGQFATYLGTVGHSGELSDLGPDDLRGWLEALRERGNADRSVLSKLTHVKSFGKWLAVEEYTQADPFARVKRPKLTDVPKPLLTPDDVDTLLQSCDRKTATGLRDRAILLTVYSTALRAAELRDLKASDVDHGAGTIIVRRGKGGKFRIVPLAPEVGRAIDRYLDHKKRAAAGYRPDYISRVESGEIKQPPFLRVMAMAQLYGKPLDDLAREVRKRTRG